MLSKNLNEDKSLYRSGSIYDAMNKSLVEDKHFYVSEFKNVTGPILELACGTGRITCPLAQSGKNITGLDISASMLAEAEKKSSRLGLKIDWRQGSMIDFNLNQKFDVIFVAYNSVHHILTNHDFKSFLTSVRKSLNPKGRFVFDIFNPSIALLNRQKVRTEMDTFLDPESGDQILVTEENVYDSATQINHVTYFYSKKDQPDFHSHPLDMRCYFPQEIDALLGYNGFRILRKYGGFDKSIFTSQSRKQVFECEISHD